MDIKNIKGSVSLDNFMEDLLSAVKVKTLGQLWEDHVSCNNCKYREICHELCEKLENERDINLYCSQVIDILTGELDPEDIEKES